MGGKKENYYALVFTIIFFLTLAACGNTDIYDAVMSPDVKDAKKDLDESPENIANGGDYDCNDYMGGGVAGRGWNTFEGHSLKEAVAVKKQEADGYEGYDYMGGIVEQDGSYTLGDGWKSVNEVELATLFEGK